MPTILHVPFTYFPDPCGGTEVYVDGLIEGLHSRGFRSAVAAPGDNDASYGHNGYSVHRFAIDAGASVARLYRQPDEVAASGFKRILNTVRPEIVHLHARTAAVSELLVDIARDAGAKVAFTYHVPHVSCVRGSLLLNGVTPCDGRIDFRRCLECAINGLGVPSNLAKLLRVIPFGLARTAAAWPLERKPISRARIPGLLLVDLARILRFLGKFDHVVAVCQWVHDVLRCNDVPVEKLTLSRQGVTHVGPKPSSRRPEHASATCRIAYFGRADFAKGPDLLVRALQRVPEADVHLDLYCVPQPGLEDEARVLRAAAQLDKRVTLLPAVAPAEVPEAIAQYDAIAVPSRVLETGPLIVLEAFATGVPVIGANLGGIAELVQDNVNGILVSPGEAEAWASAILRVSQSRRILEQLREGITPPRTMDDVAADMAPHLRAADRMKRQNSSNAPGGAPIHKPIQFEARSFPEGYAISAARAF